jgi:hypothetical protein
MWVELNVLGGAECACVVGLNVHIGGWVGLHI